MNFFIYKTVAERYAKYRPYFHPRVIEKIKTYLHIQTPLGIALDIGCGPGQSTVALKEISDHVVGIDISAEMLKYADRVSGMGYIQASAEKLPVKTNSVELITTSLAFHWFDPELFFAEARRALKDGAWLIISNNGFSGQMLENKDFSVWISDVYVKKYPTPPRNSAPMTREVAHAYGFDFTYEEEYENEVQFRVEELSAYLTTQSNVIAATEQGNEKVEDVYGWITDQIKPFFEREKATFVFTGYIWYLRKYRTM